MIVRRSGKLLKPFYRMVYKFSENFISRKGKLISDESKAANSSSNLFESAIQSLDI